VSFLPTPTKITPKRGRGKRESFLLGNHYPEKKGGGGRGTQSDASSQRKKKKREIRFPPTGKRGTEGEKDTRP